MPIGYSFVTGDTGSILKITCKDAQTEAAMDITGSTVRLKWKDAAGVLVTKVMDIVTPLQGIAQYQFAVGDLIAPKMRLEVEITDASGKVFSSIKPLEELVRGEVG